MRRVAPSVGLFKAIIWPMKRLAVGNSVSLACWKARFLHLDNHLAGRGDPGSHLCLETRGLPPLPRTTMHRTSGCRSSTKLMPDYLQYMALMQAFRRSAREMGTPAMQSDTSQRMCSFIGRLSRFISSNTEVHALNNIVFTFY